MARNYAYPVTAFYCMVQKPSVIYMYIVHVAKENTAEWFNYYNYITRSTIIATVTLLLIIHLKLQKPLLQVTNFSITGDYDDAEEFDNGAFKPRS